MTLRLSEIIYDECNARGNYTVSSAILVGTKIENHTVRFRYSKLWGRVWVDVWPNYTACTSVFAYLVGRKTYAHTTKNGVCAAIMSGLVSLESMMIHGTDGPFIARVHYIRQIEHDFVESIRP